MEKNRLTLLREGLGLNQSDWQKIKYLSDQLVKLKKARVILQIE